MRDIRERGATKLQALNPRNEEIDIWKLRLLSYKFGSAPDDPYVWLTCLLALQAVNAGNYGVGAVIVRHGEVISEGQNRTFDPHLRTDLHAEMVAVSRFEDSHPHITSAADYTLYSSLECCPMCTVRLINTGIRTVLYAAPDETSGMVHLRDNLPPFYRRLMSTREPAQSFGRPECSEALVDYAGQIFLLNEAEVSRRLGSR